MKSIQMFCSACDRDVRVMITDGAGHDGQAEVHDTELVCMDIGDRCTGNLCPLGAVAPDAMVERIIRNGLPTTGLTVVPARCPTCSADADMILYGGGRAGCTVCGSTARWEVDHAEPR